LTHSVLAVENVLTQNLNICLFWKEMEDW